MKISAWCDVSLTMGLMCVCLITKIPLKTEFWKLKTPKVFSIFITHHSKIRELSDRSKNWKQNPNRLLRHGSHHFWVMSYENRVMSYGNNKSKWSLNCCYQFFYFNFFFLISWIIFIFLNPFKGNYASLSNGLKEWFFTLNLKGKKHYPLLRFAERKMIKSLTFL